MMHGANLLHWKSEIEARRLSPWVSSWIHAPLGAGAKPWVGMGRRTRVLALAWKMLASIRMPNQGLLALALLWVGVQKKRRVGVDKCQIMKRSRLQHLE